MGQGRVRVRRHRRRWDDAIGPERPYGKLSSTVNKGRPLRGPAPFPGKNHQRPEQLEMKRGPNKVMLLGASFGTRNMGVGALAAGAIKCVRSAWPEAEICLLDYAKRGEVMNYRLQGREVLLRVANIRFSKNIFLSNNIAVLIVLAAAARLMPRSIRRKMISGNATLREIDSASIAASIAGGGSFSSIYGMGRFFYVALPQILVILMGKPLVQLPQTYGPFPNR